jgi:Zn-dependent peptidase ImmA (M78 family)/DNA-binding XRE family transcriptional regulator
MESRRPPSLRPTGAADGDVRSGTPGFVGARLREAREVRSLTLVALSEIVGVSAQSLSQYESGRSSPSPAVFERIAAAVNLPEHRFLLPERSSQAGTRFYRSMSSATKSARSRAERRFDWLRDIVGYLSEFVAFPTPNFPVLRLPADPLLLSNEEIEEAADAVRRDWGMRDDPIANMIRLLENQGAVIARDKLGAETLDGLSEFAVDEARPYIIVGTDKGSPVRWRFDAAHELGHLVLHANVRQEQLRRAETFKRIEEQAHRFAAAFLLPISSFGDDLFAPNLDAFRALKPKWKVSISAMIIRARDAGLLNEQAERSLWVNYSRRGWRRVEPHDETMDAEEPRLLRSAFDLILGAGGHTPDDVLSRLALPASDIEALCSLPDGYFGGFSRVFLRSTTQPDDEGNDSESPGQVIPLPVRRRTS